MIKYIDKDIQYLFDNLKDGDFLGFYHKPWYFIFSKIIAFFTGGKIDHVGGVFNVDKQVNTLSFELGEYKTNKGKIITKYHMHKTNEVYFIDTRFHKNYVDLFYLPNQHKITKEQNASLKEFWSTNKEPYSFMQLPLTLNWVNNIINLFRKNKKPTKARFCSGATKESMDFIGITPNKSNDLYPSPVEFVRLSYINKIFKINRLQQA